MPSEPPPIEDTIGSSILALLRGQVPPEGASPEAADAALRRLECGGYARSLWQATGRFAALPRVWAGALLRSHRKTFVDTLAALAEFRSVGGLFAEERVPFILLKGGAYLFDLYDEPGQRPLTDIDLLVRPSDAIRMRDRLEKAGYDTLKWDDEYRRFEVIAPGEGRCSFEVHWALGLAERDIDQNEIWDRSRAGTLEDVSCRRLCPEDALLFHVGHQADHFFGPSLKWVIDLRLMFRRWSLDLESLIIRSVRWRVRTALTLAVLHLDKVLPGSAPGALQGSLSLGRFRGRLLGPFLDPGPLGMLRVGNARLARYAAACLLRDRPIEIVGGLARVARRTVLRRRSRVAATAAPMRLRH